MNNTILVTGAAGFIGSAVVRQLLAEPDVAVVNIDKLTYAGNRQTVAAHRHNPRYTFEQQDICDAAKMKAVFQRHQPRALMHLAAESHVDRSIDAAAEFIQTNIVGTYTLLETAHAYWQTLATADAAAFRFHQVSTDEVFGSIAQGLFTEQSRYQPSSPYAASKAAADHLVHAWYKTYGLPVVNSNCSNNYGPYQYPEKFLPVIISTARQGQPIPLYGRGENVRDWLYVDDHARALAMIIQHGQVGQTYNVGANAECSNLQLAKMVCDILDQVEPRADGSSYQSLLEFVADRPGHDHRYAIDASRLRRELGWQPRETFASGLRKTVEWYRHNSAWVEAVLQKNSQRGQRLGLARHQAEGLAENLAENTD